MKKSAYHDIRARIPEPPRWYDENGTPRYCDFRPQESPKVDAHEVGLFEIACEIRRERFLVERNWNGWDKPEKLSEEIARVGHLDYGAPPFHGYRDYSDPPLHACAGNQTSSNPVRLVEFWERWRNSWTGELMPWKRRKDLSFRFE